MALDQTSVARFAELLEQAELSGQPVRAISEAVPQMTPQDGYAVQREIRRRKEARGHKVIGLKVGLTSRAKMKQMGIENPIFGFLFDYMSRPDGGEVRMSDLIHPRIEPEIAFVTKAPLRGPGCHIGTVLAATDFVSPALEIIDSRYQDFRFDLPSVIADNTSAARFVAGGFMRDASALDLRTVGVVVQKNGDIAALGAGAAVLGHPATAIAVLANMMAEQGEEIPAQTFIMTGGITEAIAAKPGDAFTVRFQELGSISVRFT